MNPLWLAIDLPRLPLDAHSSPPGPSPAPDRPTAVAAAARIVACDDPARAAGVVPGMGTVAARAIEPQLLVIARNPALEAAALESLAIWAGSLAPRVVLAPPQALLLEIGGCIKLFGGIDNILATARAGCEAQGYLIQAAVAPTPQGALWLARAGTSAICLDAVMLAASLDALPVASIDWPDDVKKRLAGFGARTLGDARRLPRAGLGHRIGAQAMATLARARGELPDPRCDFVFPPHFARALEFPAPVENAGALLFAARRLTGALAGWLAAHQAGMRLCRLLLGHRGHVATSIELRFASATRDATRIERVLRERLERLALVAPVESLCLSADEVAALPGETGTLFGAGNAVSEGMTVLVERLRARLGEAAVQGLVVVADHRPECATRQAAQGKAAATTPPGPRPFWLLAMPEPIVERTGRPWRNGPLRLLAGPERIESGWWDGGEGVGDARRDYFVALTPEARWAWIFRELAPPGGWFLHGWFA